MKKIGVLHGVENTFPGALVDRINALGVPGITAEIARIGAVEMGKPSGYAVLIDRISHDLPFYRSYLKQAVLEGTEVINNPFWWSADDKFFNYALASRLGVAVPRTVLLPHKNHPPQISAESLRNMEYPLDWDGVFAHVGFPAFLKPHDGGGWRDVHHVHSPAEFFRAYDQTRDLCMTLQAAVDFEEYFRCYVVGQRDVRIMPYDPRRPHDQRYIQDPPEYDPALLKRVEQDALTLCRSLGYDLNTVEFAVQGGVPYAIDFMNPAPDADFFSVGQDNFNWIVDAVARLAVDKAQAGPKLRQDLRCMDLLNGTPATASGTGAAKGSSAAEEPNSAAPTPTKAEPQSKLSKARPVTLSAKAASSRTTKPAATARGKRAVDPQAAEQTAIGADPKKKAASPKTPRQGTTPKAPAPPKASIAPKAAKSTRP